ncbi:peptide-methionine (S)-S-oxide reductase MsrA [Hellea balneolensis]|uniref:peptide-methionine (S)-S-oxide reductase MsrA n=1 Tax=Hellea balneolensis TaxID=287478 RepID=UPI000409368F|nr:peptide-methionine (S)-S-oxide reductase MsrA [Hellea balneolensis]
MKHIAIIFTALIAACSSAQSSETYTPQKVQLSGQTDTAILAGGCFWCVESDFENLPGVIEAVSGYSGGDMQNPTYRNHGQHVEVAKIVFDPTIISYDNILDHYWRHIDPTDNGGQFCDRGNAYIPVIYARPDQFEAAKASKANIEKTKPFSDPIAVPVLSAKTFWDAEEYHQDYYIKNPRRYKFYRKGCGRDARVKELWGTE